MLASDSVLRCPSGPSCRAEYRAGFTVCSDCNLKLVDKLQEITAAAAPGQGLGLSATPVFTTQQMMEANIIRGMLEAGGIEAETWSVGITGYGPALETYRVMVRAQDAGKAEALVNDVVEEGT